MTTQKDAGCTCVRLFGLDCLERGDPACVGAMHGCGHIRRAGPSKWRAPSRWRLCAGRSNKRADRCERRKLGASPRHQRFSIAPLASNEVQLLPARSRRGRLLHRPGAATLPVIRSISQVATAGIELRSPTRCASSIRGIAETFFASMFAFQGKRQFDIGRKAEINSLWTELLSQGRFATSDAGWRDGAHEGVSQAALPGTCSLGGEGDCIEPAVGRCRRAWQARQSDDIDRDSGRRTGHPRRRTRSDPPLPCRSARRTHSLLERAAGRQGFATAPHLTAASASRLKAPSRDLQETGGR